ncbi:hypothetical protein OIU76_004077 [Salix suchowensis]|nr:hypothetical protein OIU78_013849 [Salix suchowensis]KAJ6347527.1 hypothetical protein OIU76_004077 [Salix suchowensis]
MNFCKNGSITMLSYNGLLYWINSNARLWPGSNFVWYA